MDEPKDDNTLPPEDAPLPSEDFPPLVESEPVDELPPDEQDELFLNRSNAGLSSGPGKMIAFGAVMLVVVGFVIYTLFFSAPKTINPKRLEALSGATGNVDQAPVVAAPPPAPALAQATPEMVTPPTPPPPPPPPPAPPAPPSPVVTQPAAEAPLPPPPMKPSAPPPPLQGVSSFRSGNDKDQQMRLRSNMLVLAGTPAAAPAAAGAPGAAPAADPLANNDPNRAFSNNVLAASKAEKEMATRVNNLGLTIAQGKIVDAVLETAVNTDLPGTLRAIVSRDVYAESGRDVMIPKGSRLIGTYNTGVARGQVRVMIIWTRLIRPDGVDMQIGSPGVDTLGRAGIAGIADNKYSEIFSAAILTSVLNVGVAIAVDALSNQSSTTTTNANGTTSVGSSAGPAGAAAVGTLGSISKDVVNSMLDLRPTITIDQGTKLNVFVNKDLSFPSPVATDRSFVE